VPRQAGPVSADVALGWTTAYEETSVSLSLSEGNRIQLSGVIAVILAAVTANTACGPPRRTIYWPFRSHLFGAG